MFSFCEKYLLIGYRDFVFIELINILILKVKK